MVLPPQRGQRVSENDLPAVMPAMRCTRAAFLFELFTNVSMCGTGNAKAGRYFVERRRALKGREKKLLSAKPCVLLSS